MRETIRMKPPMRRVSNHLSLRWIYQTSSHQTRDEFSSGGSSDVSLSPQATPKNTRLRRKSYQMNKNTSEESNKSKNSNRSSFLSPFSSRHATPRPSNVSNISSDSTNLTFVSIQASRRTTRCSRTSWFFEELRTSGQRRNNMLGCSNAVLFGCLVFLAAFIGLYFLIEIQAKSKIAEVPDPRPQNPQNAENFSRMVELLRNECHDNNVWAENLDNKKWCSTSWDLIFCWPPTEVEKTATIKCPDALKHFDTSKKLQRKCYYNATTETAEWQSYKTKAEQLAECLTDEKSHLSKNIINIVIIMNIVGASISCLALGLSIIILSSLRKIRSTRNHIHCNLFLAWIFNTIFKCLLFVQGNNWAHLLNGCAITILAVYGSIIQMSWTLIEGIHLHLLLSISHFPKHNYYLAILMSLGWGIPILLVVGQICHNKIIGFENCFPEGSSIRYWNEIPIIVMLTINFEIFILIISKISTKLIPNGGQRHGSHSSPTCPGNATRGTGRTVPTLRLAKATLTLIPVMGMQNLLFILIPSQGVEDRTIEIRNLIEQSLEAYSGILVAIIYCYLNHEVQGEIGRYIMNTRLRWLIFEERRTGVERFRQRVSRVSQDVSVIQPKRKSRRTRSKRLSKKNSRKCSIGETRKLRDEASSTRILSSDRDDSEEVINKIDNYDFESTDYNV